MSSKKSGVYEDIDELKRRYLNSLDEKYDYFNYIQHHKYDIEDRIRGCLYVIKKNSDENNLSQQQKEDMIGVLNDIIDKYINLLINIEIKYKFLNRAHELITQINANTSARSLRGGSNKKVKKVKKVRKIKKI